MIDTPDNYYNAPPPGIAAPAGDIAAEYSAQRYQRQQEQERKRAANPRGKRYEFVADGLVDAMLQEVPAGERTRLINAALREYFEANHNSQNTWVFVPRSGVFLYSYVLPRMDRQVRDELEFNNDAITPQDYVDQYSQLHEQLTGFPWIVKKEGRGS